MALAVAREVGANFPRSHDSPGAGIFASWRPARHPPDLAASPHGLIRRIMGHPHCIRDWTVMRSVYGAIAFVAVVFVSLVALQRMLG
jgi:hypothetical protein